MLTAAERAARARQYRALRKARLASPGLIARVAGDVPTAELTPFEQAIRGIRQALHEEAARRDGVAVGALSLTRTWQLDALLTRHILKGRLEADVIRLAETGGLVNLRSRRAHPIVADLLRALDGYERALESVGVGPLKAAPLDLQEQARLATLEEAAKAQGSVAATVGSQASRSPQAPETTRTKPVEPQASAGVAAQPPRLRPETVEARPLTLAPTVPDF